MADESLALLAERMARGSRTIAFVGAGASRRCNYPTWSELVNLLRIRAYGPLSKGPADLRAAAELYSSVLSERGRLETEVRAALHAGGVQPAGEFHARLSRLPFKHYITTNYDTLIEDALNEISCGDTGSRVVRPDMRCRSLNGRNADDFNDFLASLAEEEPQRSVLHLHGILDQQLTLTMGQYDDQYLGDAMQLRMFSIFATSTIVFIGASLRDPDVMELVRRSNHHGARRPRHFAFLPGDRREEAQILKQTYGIRPIFYEHSRGDQHQNLDYMLDHLLELHHRAETREGSLHDGEGAGFLAPIVLQGHDLTPLVERVEDAIRRTPRGAVTISGLNPSTASMVLRHVVRRYRELPPASSFDSVVWLSPRRLGVFPGCDHPQVRNIEDVLFGGLVAKLGAHRLTATRHHEKNLEALGRVLEERSTRLGDRRRALIVVEDACTLVGSLGSDGHDPIAEMATRLPYGSRIVYRIETEDGRSKHHVSFAEGNLLPEPEAAAVSSACGGGSMGEFAAQILGTLAISAHPLEAAELAAILRDPEHAPDRLSSDLEVHVAEVRRITALAGALVEAGLAIVEQEDDKVWYTLAAPMRSAVLACAADDPDAGKTLRVASAELLKWAESVVGALRKWEVDSEQFDQLTRRLPVLVSIFEAACCLGKAERDDADIDRVLWLGRDLSRFLYRAGRVPEALQLAEFLCEKAHCVSEPDVLEREAQLLVAAIGAHTATTAVELEKAAQAARQVSESAQAVLAELEKAAEAARQVTESAQAVLADPNPHEPGSYAPARITPRRQLAEAEIRLAQCVLPSDPQQARSRYRALYEEYREEGSQLDEDRQILGDVAGWLAETEHQDVLSGTGDVTEVLRVMDVGHRQLEQLDNRRRMGFHARLRGAVMEHLDNVLAARRSYVEALLAAHEFKDRFLEGRAKLGLARVDRSRQLAGEAIEVFDELRHGQLREEAANLRRKLSKDEPLGPPHTPDLVVFIGAPGAGKALARDATLQLLDQRGYHATVARFNPKIDEFLREGKDIDPALVRNEVSARLAEASGGRQHVMLAKLSLWETRYLEAWEDQRSLLGRMLVVNAFAPRNVLRRRNEQRFSGELPRPVLARVTKDGKASRPPGYESWRSWFEERGASFVSLQTGLEDGALDVPFHEIRTTLCRELAKTFESPDCNLRAHGLRAGEPCRTAAD